MPTRIATWAGIPVALKLWNAGAGRPYLSPAIAVIGKTSVTGSAEGPPAIATDGPFVT